MLLQSPFLILHPLSPASSPLCNRPTPSSQRLQPPFQVSLSGSPSRFVPQLHVPHYLQSHGHPLRDPTFFKAGVSLKLRRVTGVFPPRSLIPCSHLLRALEMGFSVNGKRDHFHSAPRVILGRGSCFGSFLLINRLNWAIQVLRADKGLLPFLR